MGVLDPLSESQRLAKVYSGMADGELASLAADAGTLTELARQALRRELQRRRGFDTVDEGLVHGLLSPPGSEGGPHDVASASDSTGAPELRSLVAIRKFQWVSEAELAKSLLDAAGVKSSLTDDNIVSVYGFISNVVGGVGLQVNEEDLERANEVLDQPSLDKFEVEGIGEYQQPRCPDCRSSDVMLGRTSWECCSCGARWEEGEPATDRKP